MKIKPEKSKKPKDKKHGLTPKAKKILKSPHNQLYISTFGVS